MLTICFILNTVDSNSTRLNCTGAFICRFFPVNMNYSTRGWDGKSLPAMQEIQIQPWVRKGLWRREWLPTPGFLRGEFHGQRSLAGHSPWGWKESDMAEQLTLSHYPQLVESMDLEPWSWRASYKIIHRFLTAWRASTYPPRFKYTWKWLPLDFWFCHSAHTVSPKALTTKF